MSQRKVANQSTKKVNKNKNNDNIKNNFFVTFLGVRGTIPTPFKDFLKYGGNTSCIEVSSTFKEESINILFDAGTGIINYGEQALRKGVKVFHIFLTHMHYDHIIGLSKFTPLFRTDCEIHIYGQAKLGKSLKNIIQDFFTTPFFPIEFHQLPSLKKIFFYELNSIKSTNVGHIQIDFQYLNHPQNALAYRIWNADKTANIVYATDHEHGTSKDRQLKKFIQNSKLFIYDSTYSDLEYKNFVGWGHSTAKYGAQLAKACGVKDFAIFHHDPTHNDKYLEKYILTEAKKIFKNSFLAKENITITVTSD